MKSPEFRICILGQAAPTAWMPHLISAFQEVCDVRTVGPVIENLQRDAWPGEWPPPNHIDVDLAGIGSLSDLFPVGWSPHLVVAISGGGIPMFTNTHDLTCPTVFYSVDTWQCYMDYHEALHYDIVFTGQRAYVPLLRAAGSRHVHWLPMACNPALHRPVDSARKHDVVFVGGTSEPVHWRRSPLLNALQSRFDVFALERVYGEAMVHAYASGHIAFNHSAVHDVNMRIFEALAMGCALLTNRDAEANGLTDLFEDGKHLLVYENEKDLIEKASQLLSNKSLRNRIRNEGRTEVLARHTYAHRTTTIVDTVRALVPGFPNDFVRPIQRGQNLIDYLPLGCESVLDYGMGLHASKYALAKRGVARFAGISNNEEVCRQRIRSFDAIFTATEVPYGERFDAVAIESQHVSDAAIRNAWTYLVEGGALIVKCDAAQLTIGAALDSWLRERDFHFIYKRVLSARHTIVVARKRTRRLRDIAREVCNTLNVSGVDSDTVASMMNADW